jgi:biopolymer transport protein ExbD
MANVTRNITDPTIVLRIDNALTIQDLVDVLQIGNKLKIKMVLATKPNQP